MAALALAGLFARFLRHDLCPFVLDEPTLLAAAREQPLHRQWLEMSPLMGTQGVHYGPVYFVLERFVVSVWGSRPEAMLFVQCALLTAAHVGLAYGIARALGGGLWTFGWAAGSLAASTCQFFYSRTAWDNPLVNACVACVVLLLAQRRMPSLARCVLLGLLLGAAIGTHLMVMSFVCCVLLVLAWEGRNELAHTASKLGLVLLAIVLVNGSYFLYLARQHVLAPATEHRFALRKAFDFLVDAAGSATAARASYFFDDDWPLFLRWLGSAASILPGRVCALTLTALAMLGLMLTFWRREGAPKRLALLALLTWLSHAAFCALRHLDLHPHYQQPSYWVIPLGLCALLVQVRHRAVELVLCAGLTLFIVVQFSFIERWMAFIDMNGGTRGVHYSVPLGLQTDVVKRACATSAPTIIFDNRTVLFPASLKYLASIDPSCRGKEVAFCTEHCPRTSQQRSVFRLEYADSGGRLR